MTLPIDDHCNCFSTEYVRRFTKENMLETLYVHLQDSKDTVQEMMQDISDIELLISQLEGKESHRNGKPLC